MEILYNDKNIVVCIKPAGALSEGTDADRLPAMLSVRLSELGEDSTCVFPVHRLDKETSGVMVYARTSSDAAALSEDIRKGSLVKQYLAVVHGTPQASSGTLTDLLFFDRARVKSFIVGKERKGVKKAVLEYTVLSERDGLSLVSIRLHTGRTHQIRAQFSSRGLPLVGDRRYGAPKSEFQGVALLSRTLTFPHPNTRQMLTFTAPIPETLPWTLFDIER